MGSSDNSYRLYKEWIDKAGLLVGFNIKYDLHWLKRLGIDFTGKVLWDCQLAEFIIGNQKNPYPDLGSTAMKYGVTSKGDIITRYINTGIDVGDIPPQELIEYLKGDLTSTWEVFTRQIDEIKPSMSLFKLQCQDLAVLSDMEYNGLKYDLETSEILAENSRKQEDVIINVLNELVKTPDPRVAINWNSGDHLSCILYGGTVPFKHKEFVGVYQSGAKKGNPRYSHKVINYTFPRLVEPLQGSELKKEGFYSTDEATLKSLKATGFSADIIKRVLMLSELSKARSTYYEGIPKRFEEFGWNDGCVHGQLNQCVAVTGRLASSKPNLQNIPKDSKECFVSRYAD